MCPYCRQPVTDLADHISHNPPRGCWQVAVALDRTWWPQSERPARLCRRCDTPALPRVPFCREHRNEWLRQRYHRRKAQTGERA